MKLALNLHPGLPQQTAIRSAAVVAALAATLTVASVARLDGPWGGAQPGQGAGAPAAGSASAANVALVQTLVGNGYVEFLVGEAPVFVAPVGTATNVALEQTLAGAGFLEFQPGEGAVVRSQVGVTPSGIGVREFLDGEGVIPSLPAQESAPLFGPQP